MAKELFTCPLCGEKAEYVYLFSLSGRRKCLHYMKLPATLQKRGQSPLIPITDEETLGRLCAEGRFEEELHRCLNFAKMISRA